MRPRLPIHGLIVAPLVASVAWSSPARADTPDVPQLAWGRPVRCIDLPNGKRIRVQCDVDARGERCLVAPDQSHDGVELDQVQPCVSHESGQAYDDIVARGARIVPALAEVPPGYARSTEGRAFQVKFDLLNRLYVGVAWAPTFVREGAPTPPSFPLGRAQAESGIHVSALSPSSRARHDLRILEGTATFGDLELNGLLLAYDYQHMHRRPAFWLSTFIGEPRVYPVPSPIGWGFRLLEIRDRPPSFRDTLDVEMAEVHVSWNPWQSNDLYSHIRVEAGGDVGKYWENREELSDGLETGLWYGGFSSTVKTRLSLGEGGLHYLFADFAYRRPTMATGDMAGQAINRLEASLAYEAIFLAINDQPLSLRVATEGTTRNDLASDVRSVELKFTAGLRFSFWAPPRVFEPLPEYEDP